MCGSDLHIYHGRVQIEPGLHDRPRVRRHGRRRRRRASRGVAVGDRVLGCFHTACGDCFFCRRGLYHRCLQSRTFGHGATLGSLQGTQAEMALVPRANLVLRRVPEGMSSDVALFAGDVMGTGFHAVDASGLRPGDVAAVLGLGPVGLCAVQAARAIGAAHVFAIDTVPERLAVAERLRRRAGAPRPSRTRARSSARRPKAAASTSASTRSATPRRSRRAIRLTRACGSVQCIGVYAERTEVHMGLLWLKALTLRGGQANVIAHVDRVLAMLSAGVLDPSPLVTHHMTLDEAPEAYAVYDRREALKIVLTP